MERSQELNELAKALAEAQAELKMVEKDNVNPHFGKKYATLGAVIETFAPVISKNGLSVTQFIGHDDGADILTTWLLHTSGQYMADSMRLRPVKNDPQAQGSATTYARRYSYMAVLGLAPDEDDDGNAASQQNKTQRDNSEGNAQRSGGAAAKKATATKTTTSKPPAANPANLQKLMVSELQGEQKPAFLTWFAKNLPNEKLTDVSAGVRETVEKAINSFACGEVPADMTEPF